MHSPGDLRSWGKKQALGAATGNGDIWKRGEGTRQEDISGKDSSVTSGGGNAALEGPETAGGHQHGDICRMWGHSNAQSEFPLSCRNLVLWQGSENSMVALAVPSRD